MTRIFPSEFTEKATPVSADKIMIADSADGNYIKRISFADLQGPQGVGITWRGAYNGATAYVVNDAVSYTNGLSYICILASTGNVPTNATYWSPMADSIVATESSKGAVRLGTTTDVTNGTDTESSEPLVVQPSMLKTTNDNLDVEKLKIKSKVDVVAATTANITLSGTQTIDGVAVTAGQRVLVKDQSTASGNGIYLCDASTWTRVTDFDANTNNEVDLGACVWVEGGSTNGGTEWTLTTTGAITVGSTSLTFTKTYPATTTPDYISSAAVSGSVSVPATANVALIEATCTNGGVRIGKGDLILTRTGKTSASLQFAETNSVANDPEFVASWSGSTITITGDSVGGTVYFYTHL